MKIIILLLIYTLLLDIISAFLFDPDFPTVYKKCTYICDHGACSFEYCGNSPSCPGGACKFYRSISPSCSGFIYDIVNVMSKPVNFVIKCFNHKT